MAEAATRRGFAVGVDPRALDERAAGLRSRLVRQAISAALGTVISVVLFMSLGLLGGGSSGRPPSTLTVLVIVGPALYGWIRLIAEVVRRHDARRAQGLVEPGPVLRVERPGLVLRNGNRFEYLRWEQISAIRGVRRFDLPGPELRVERLDGTYWAVPFLLLDAKPGGIDAAVRAYAGERFGLDMGACDDIW